MRKIALLIAVLLVGTATITAVAWPSIPDSSGNVNACYRMTTGELRVSDSGCLGDETALVLNTLPGYEVVSTSHTIADADGTGNPDGTGTHPYGFGGGSNMYEDEILCPVGKNPLSGGILITGSGVSNDDGVVSSYPSALNEDYAADGWVVKFHLDPESGGQDTYTLYAVCANTP